MERDTDTVFKLTIQVLDNNVKIKRMRMCRYCFYLNMAFWFTGLLCVCLFVCMFVWDTAKMSMINTQHTTFTSNDSTVYFSWNQSKAHIYYLQICTICVCVCVCVRSELSGESGIAVSTRGQCTDLSGGKKKKLETEPRCFNCCALWVCGLIHHSSGGTSRGVEI